MIRELNPENLRKICDPKTLGCDTSKDMKKLECARSAIPRLWGVIQVKT
jgi:hypothetical protein